MANQSGGSGKTTSATALATVLATEHHKRVRVIDADTNRDASRLLGYDDPDAMEGQATINDVLFMDTTLAEATLPARIRNADGSWRTIPNLLLVPGSLELAKLDLSLASEMKRDERLFMAFENDDDPADVEIVDGPASLGLLMINILMAVDEIYGAVKAGIKEIRALDELEKTAAEVNKFRPGRPVELAGIIVTDRPSRTAGQAYLDAVSLLVKTYGREFILPYPEDSSDEDEAHQYGISRSVKVPEAYDAMQPINLYAPTSPPARDYSKMANQLVRAGLV